VKRVTLEELFDEMDLYGFEDFEETQKLRLLNETYFDIVTREPWPFLERVNQFIAPSASTQITNMGFAGSPNDVNNVLSFTDLTHNVVMTPVRGDEIEKNYRVANINSFPDKYYFIGEDVFVYPEVRGDTQYRLYYVRKPINATLSTNTVAWFIPERHHSVVLYGALVKAFLVNDDPQATIFQNLFEQRYQQMRNDLWMRQYDRTERMHVMSDSYDWNY
jgi:hypothetical protein